MGTRSTAEASAVPSSEAAGAKNSQGGVDWTAREGQLIDLLAELSRVDTTNPPGRSTETCARILAGYLERHDVSAEIVPMGPGRAGVFARIKSSSSDPESPLLLASNLDTTPVDVGVWDRRAPPFGGIVAEGALFGRGVLAGKAAASLHATTLSILKAHATSLDRDVFLVAVPDGAASGVDGLDAVVRRHPEVATASIALTGSGLGIENWLGDDRIVHHVTNAELGFVRMSLVATVRSSSHGGQKEAKRPPPLDANVLLARAIDRVFDSLPPPRTTDAVMRVMKEVGREASFPESIFLSNEFFVRLLWLGSLADRPSTRSLVADDFRIAELIGSPTRGTARSVRARAELLARLLPDTTPAEAKSAVELAIADGNVHVTIRDGEPAVEGPRSRALESILRRRLPIDSARRQVVAFGYASSPTIDRELSRIGIRTYGILPFVIDHGDLASLEGQNEHVSLENLKGGLRRMVAIAEDVTALSSR